LRRSRHKADVSCSPGRATQRALERLRWIYIREIEKRGGEARAEKTQLPPLAIVDRDPALRMAVLHTAGWRKYGRMGSFHARLSYLCGRDGVQTWAVRLPGTITRVADAVAWLEPAAVRKARVRGAAVLRQGDVYIVPTRVDDFSALPPGHTWDASTRTLRHGQHDAIHLETPHRAVPQRPYAMGRVRARRGRGD